MGTSSIVSLRAHPQGWVCDLWLTGSGLNAEEECGCARGEVNMAAIPF